MIYTNALSLSENLEALASELQHSRDYEKTQMPCVESDFEIESDSDWCGSIYKVCKNYCSLGVFYQKRGKWVAEPYYLNYRSLNLSEYLGTTFRSNELAIRHIIACYEGIGW